MQAENQGPMRPEHGMPLRRVALCVYGTAAEAGLGISVALSAAKAKCVDCEPPNSRACMTAAMKHTAMTLACNPKKHAHVDPIASGL